MEKTFLESIIPFITNMRKGVSEDQPIVSLIKFKGGDTFKDFHFDTTKTPVKDDFDNWTDSDFGSYSLMCGFDWYCEDEKSHEPVELDTMIMAYFFPKGMPMGEGVVVEQDSFGIIYGAGYPIYCDEGMAQVLSLMMGGEVPVGWASDSMKNGYTSQYYLQENAYGHLWNQGTEGVDYNKDWNGKFIGFKEEDYYEPGPAPTTYTITTNSIDNTTISGEGTYEEGTDVVVSIQANNGYSFVGTPTATENGEALELTNVEGVYSATITVNQNVSIEFTATVEEQPTPITILPLYNGLTLHNSDKLAVDTTKGDEFASYLGTLAYSESRYTLMTSQYQGQQVRLMRARQGDNPGEYFVIIGNKPIYATYTGSWNGWMDGVEYDVSFTEGFNNVENGYYAVDLSIFSTDYQDILAITDTDPATWNGVIIGTY